MNCIGRAPVSLEEWLEIVDGCARAAGGPDWVHTATMGVLVVVGGAFLVLALVAVVRAAR